MELADAGQRGVGEIETIAYRAKRLTRSQVGKACTSSGGPSSRIYPWLHGVGEVGAPEQDPAEHLLVDGHDKLDLAPWIVEHGPIARRPPFEATSRETVDGGRPRPTAIRRSESPARRPREISSRSALESRRVERTVFPWLDPAERLTINCTKRLDRPTPIATSPSRTPVATRRRISIRQPWSTISIAACSSVTSLARSSRMKEMLPWGCAVTPSTSTRRVESSMKNRT